MLFQEEQNSPSIFHNKMTFSGSVIIALLVLALIGLGERVLYDLARVIAPPPLDYFENLGVILVHAFFVIPVLVISIIINVAVSTKSQKYAIVLIPYYIFSIILALQLALQLAIYFAFHHTVVQFYIVMILFAAVSTYGIYYIQKRFKPNV